MATKDLGRVRGYSAYEIAQKNGFSGSEKAWLESLKGEKGEDGNQPIDLSNYATKAELNGKANTSHTHSDYATKSELNGKANTSHSHSEYATKAELAQAQVGGGGSGSVDLSAYATKTELNGKADTNHTHSDYATKADLAGLGSGGGASISANELKDLAQGDIQSGSVLTLKNDMTVENPFFITSKNNITIDGNNKTATLTNGKFLVIDGCTNITIKNLNIVTRGTDIKSAWAFVVANGNSNIVFENVRIDGSNSNFSASGIMCVSAGSAGGDTDSYYNRAYRIVNCFFTKLRCAIAWVGRAEFGLVSSSRIYSCKVGCFSHSGNWSVIGTKISVTSVPYASVIHGSETLNAQWTNESGAVQYAPSPANYEHGTIVGCEFNHGNSGGSNRPPAVSNDFYMNASSHAQSSNYPTADNNQTTGVQFRGCITPTITGCTFYYCNLFGNTSSETKQVITGCTFDNACTIKNSQADKWYVIGCGKNGGGPAFNNVIDLDAKILSTQSQTIDTSGFATKSEIGNFVSKSEYNSLLQMIRDIQDGKEVEVPEDVVEKVLQWVNATSEDYTPLHSGNDVFSNLTMTTAKSAANDGVLFSQDVTGMEFDVVGSAQFALFGIIIKEDSGKYWVLQQGWAASNATVREAWTKVSLNGDWTGTAAVSGADTVASNLGWGGNYTVGPNSHIKIWKDGDSIKYSCTNNTYANHKNISEKTLSVPTTGNFRFGLVQHNGGASVISTISNVKIYKLA